MLNFFWLQFLFLELNQMLGLDISDEQTEEMEANLTNMTTIWRLQRKRNEGMI